MLYTVLFFFHVLFSLMLAPIFIWFPPFVRFAFVGSTFGIRSNGFYDLLGRCFVPQYLKVVYASQPTIECFTLSEFSRSRSLFFSSFAAGFHFQFRLMALSYDPDIPISISMI